MNIQNKRACFFLEAALFIHLEPSFNFSRRGLFRNRRVGNRFCKKNNESVLETNKLLTCSSWEFELAIDVRVFDAIVELVLETIVNNQSLFLKYN